VNFRRGQRVVVVKPVGIHDREFRGRRGEFLDYTKNHGFARVYLDGAGIILLHPESLSPLGSQDSKIDP
jgi:hypothetical protein